MRINETQSRRNLEELNNSTRPNFMGRNDLTPQEKNPCRNLAMVKIKKEWVAAFKNKFHIFNRSRFLSGLMSQAFFDIHQWREARILVA